MPGMFRSRITTSKSAPGAVIAAHAVQASSKPVTSWSPLRRSSALMIVTMKASSSTTAMRLLPFGWLISV